MHCQPAQVLLPQNFEQGWSTISTCGGGRKQHASMNTSGTPVPLQVKASTMSCFAIGCGHLPSVANHTKHCMDLVCSFVFPPVQLCKLQHSKSGHPELEKGLIRASKGLIGLFCWPFESSYLSLPISNTSLLERQQGKGNPTVIAKTSTVRVIVTFSVVWSQFV